jgi:MFS family permease
MVGAGDHTGSLSMVMIDQTVVSVALPSMQRDLDLSQTGIQWVVNAYILALAVLVAAAGRLGDAAGRVRAFVTGVVMSP